MAAAAAAWLESYVRANPGEIGPKFIERFASG
jgi:hypothetical protein